METIISYDFSEYGTHKSVGAEEVIANAIENEVDTIVVISSGNYLNAIVNEIEKRSLTEKIRVVNLVNKKTEGSRCIEIVIEKNRILRDAKEREDFVASQLNNVGKIKDYTDFCPSSYRDHAERILSLNPDYVAIGVGSGKFYLALCEVIKSNKLKTKIVGILPKNENGVFNDKNLHEIGNKLYFKKFNPTSIADKLVCPYVFHKKQILDSLTKGHLLIEVQSDSFKWANTFAKNIGLQAEISGSAGFIIHNKDFRKKIGIPENKNLVAVNTGRGYSLHKENQLVNVSCSRARGVEE